MQEKYGKDVKNLKDEESSSGSDEDEEAVVRDKLNINCYIIM